MFGVPLPNGQEIDPLPSFKLDGILVGPELVNGTVPVGGKMLFGGTLPTVVLSVQNVWYTVQISTLSALLS